MNLLRLVLPSILLAGNVFAATPRLIPLPREMREMPGRVALSGPVGVLGAEKNPRAARALSEALAEAGIAKASSPADARAVIALGPDACAGFGDEATTGLAGLGGEAYRLTLLPAVGDRKPAALLCGSTEAGTFYAVQTLRQILAAGKSPRALVIRDWPAFALERGYGEFFYWRPWSHEERKAAIRFMGRTKMNLYMYAPKDDPYHRERWKEDYPTTEVERLKELIDLADENFTTFSFAVSPGLSMMYSSDADFALLTRKYERMIRLGCRNISLQLDDIPHELKFREDTERFKTQGAAHAFIINRVWRWLKEKHPGVRYSACGVMYYIAVPDDYTRTLGQEVDPEIPLMWTGSDVVDSYISTQEIYQYGAGIRRPPFVSDNYPVNDFSTNRLFMGPLTGRRNDMVHHVYNGFLENPMNQEEASKIGLGTIADYAWNPEAYDPEQSWAATIRLVAGDRGYDALRLFCEQSRNTVMEYRESLELTALVNRYLRDHDGAARKPLAAYLRKLAVIDEALTRTVENKALLAEITPWVDKLTMSARAALLALEIEGAPAGAPVAGQWEKLERLRAAQATMAAHPQEVCGGRMETIIFRALKRGVGLLPPQRDIIATAPDGRDVMNASGVNLLQDIVDGHLPSAFLSDRAPKPGDALEVRLARPRPVRAIRVRQNNGTYYPMQFVYQGELQGSADGRSWKTLTRAITPEFDWSPARPEALRAARLLVREPQEQLLVVREIDVDIADRPVISGTLHDATATSAALLQDGRLDRPFRVEGPVPAGAAVQFAFANPQHVSSVTVLQNTKARLSDAVVEVSEDRTSWKVAGELNAAAVRVPVNGKVAAVRLRTRSAQNGPAEIQEIAIADGEGTAW